MSSLMTSDQGSHFELQSLRFTIPPVKDSIQSDQAVQPQAAITTAENSASSQLNPAAPPIPSSEQEKVYRQLIEYALQGDGSGTKRIVTHENQDALRLAKRSGQPANSKSFVMNFGPLWAAVEGGNMEIVEDFLNRGADPNETHPISGLPAILASMILFVTSDKWLDLNHKKQIKLTEILINLGADTRAQTENRNTLLLCAVRTGILELVNMVHTSGAQRDISKANLEGYTPLHMACELGFYDIVLYLLVSGARIHRKTPQQISPLDVAFDLFVCGASRSGLESDEESGYCLHRNSFARSRIIGRLLLRGARFSYPDVSTMFINLRVVGMLHRHRYSLSTFSVKTNPDMANLLNYYAGLYWLDTVVRYATTNDCRGLRLLKDAHSMPFILGAENGFPQIESLHSDNREFLPRFSTTSGVLKADWIRFWGQSN
ncbi:MAG: hypothetical protein MMC23_002265 [Stictis urceolatum]|nr:hypothetical protein [Stictis urceolata]